MWRRRVSVAVVCAVGLLGCGRVDGESVGVADAGRESATTRHDPGRDAATDAPATAEDAQPIDASTVKAFCSTYNQLLSVQGSRCYGDSVESWSIYQNGIFPCDMVASAVAAGRLAFDATEAAACIGGSVEPLVRGWPSAC